MQQDFCLVMVEVDYRVNDLKPASTSFKHANVGNSAAAAFLHQHSSNCENHLNFISGDELAGRLQEDFFCESDAFSDASSPFGKYFRLGSLSFFSNDRTRCLLFLSNG